MTTNRTISQDEILTAAANGNAAALEFLRVFARRAHWVDDVVDSPVKMDAHSVARLEYDWLMCLSANSFFVQHKAHLVPVMVLALNAWVSSEEWKNIGEHHGRAAIVLAGMANEVFWLVAMLTGGWDKMREVSERYRDYDFEDLEQEPAKEAKETKTVEALRCANCGELVQRDLFRDRTGQHAFCATLCMLNWQLGQDALKGKEANGLGGR